VSEVRTRSIRYLFIFRKALDKSEVARGQMTAVCATLDKSTGQIAASAIPESLRAQITAAPGEMTAPPRSRS
jgi:hypothetical protein